MGSLASRVVPALLARAPRELVTKRAAERLRGLACQVALPVAGLALEVRLEDASDAVDIAAMVRPEQALLARWAGPTGDDPPHDIVSAWQHLERFRECWVHPDSGRELRAAVPTVFLELDDRGSAGAFAMPHVFLGLDPPLEAGGVRSAVGVATHEPRTDRFRAVVLEALARASGVKDDVLVSLATVLAALPDDAVPLQLGTVRRERCEGRMLLFVPARRALDCLERLGWPGQLAAVREAVRVTGVDDSFVNLHLAVVGGGVAPRLGIEVMLDGTSSAPVARDVAALLARLVHLGGSPDKCRALTLWPGEEVLERAGRMSISRRLSHVKIVVQPDAPTRVKAYLGALIKPTPAV